MTRLKTTRSVCSRCLAKVPAEVVAHEDGAVYLHKSCPEHGPEQALLASDRAFYYVAHPAAVGDGACCAMGNHSCTLIFEIVEGCDLSCPTCFAAAASPGAYMTPLEELERQLAGLLGAGKGSADIVQLSGGEPTLHPDLERIIARFFERGVAKIYLNTNGIRLAREPDLAERLGQYAGRLQIYLQLDGFRDTTYQALRGAKLVELKRRAVDNAVAAGLYVLPVMTVTRGVNLDEIGDVIRFCAGRHPQLNGLVLQPAMYAGRYHNQRHQRRVTLAEVAAEVERQTDAMFTRADFGPIPCSDPNCFSMAVGLMRDGTVTPVSRYFPRYDTWAEPGVAERIEQFSDRMPQHMLETLNDDALLDQLLDLLAEDEDAFDELMNFFIVCVKPFQDAHTYDQSRVDRCCTHVVDRVGVPVSLCEYNTLRRPRGLR